MYAHTQDGGVSEGGNVPCLPRPQTYGCLPEMELYVAMTSVGSGGPSRGMTGRDVPGRGMR